MIIKYSCNFVLLNINGDSKKVLSFCSAAIFYDFKNVGNIQELNQARKGLINNFDKTIPVSRMPVTLSILNDVILKNNDNYIENNIENNHKLWENILYMLSFEKVIREEQEAIKTIWRLCF